MGLDINTSTLLREWIDNYGLSGPVLTLGVQHLNFSWAEFAAATGITFSSEIAGRTPTASELFRSFGIADTLSLDMSDYEGADFLFDLNNDTPPAQLRSRFGIILNGGTIEHVFNLPHALAAISRMLRPDGFVIHIVPVNNWIDHGFYQINPTLLFDYYAAAKFDILESAGLVIGSSENYTRNIFPLLPGDLMASEANGLRQRSVLCMFAARKTIASLDEATPTQSVYAGGLVYPPRTLRWFAPYSTSHGRRSGGAFAEWSLGSFAREEGSAWVATLPGDAPMGDSVEHPRRSPLVLFEDGRLLGPGHALHNDIRHTGGGCYSHWQDIVLFSSSDGSDPNLNGRRYTVVASLD